MSIINDPNLQSQLLSASNCAPYYCPPPVLYTPPNAKQLTVEAVDGGYLISGHFHGKGHSRTVAVSAKGLTGILKGWSAQFEAKAGA